MPILPLLRSARADNIGNYPGMRLDRYDKTFGTSDGLLADLVRIILGQMPGMCLGEFGVPPIGDVYLQMAACRSIIVSLSIGTILGEVTFR